MAAGERNMSCRPDVIEMVEEQGFVREAEDGFYRWERNKAA
jgi:hypothetical protein